MEQKSETKTKKTKEKKSGKKSKDIRIIVLVAVLAFLVVIGTLCVFAASYDKVYSNINVCDVDLGGKTEKEVYDLLIEKFGETAPTITVSAGDETLDIDFVEIARYDFSDTSKKVYEKGRANFFDSFFTYITPFISRDVAISVEFDEEKLEDILIDLQAKVDGGYQKPICEVAGEELLVNTGHGGLAIDVDSIKNEIIDGLEHSESVSIVAKLTDKEFQVPDANKIYKEIHSEPKDAYYDKENNSLVDHKDGYDFDKDVAKNILSNAKENEEYKIPLKVIPASKTISDLELELFSDLLGTYSTKYTASNYNRSHNVALAASRFNGYIMMPGEVFSYNDVVGDRTVAAGFKSAGVYTANGVENGIGGGICQVSSTLYNAVLYANLEIVSRTNHSYTVSYAPKGQDATVSMGSIDFKFRNSADAPIMIKTYVGGGTCTVSVYGKKSEEFSVVVESTVLSTTPFGIEYEDDETMPVGEEKVKTAGMTGYSVSTVRHITKNGKTVTEKLPSSRYVPLTQVVIRGTMEENIEGETGEESTDLPQISDNPEVEESTTDTDMGWVG